jgi:hypothetical protein
MPDGLYASATERNAFKKRHVLNKIRALMDKNGVVMERFETFRMWEFFRVHPAEGGTSSAGKSAKGKNVPDSSA